MEPRHVFVIGLDEFNRSKLETTDLATSCRFHALLDHDEIRGLDEFDVDTLLDECLRRLEDSGEPVDAVVSFWDFPVSEMLPIICRQLGLPGPSLESVLRCHHKYWSRLEQQQVVPECVPRFELVDPWDEDSISSIGLERPFWLKPVRSFRSHLGFRIGDASDLRKAIAEIRAHLPRLADPFDRLLPRAQLDPRVEGVHGGFCLAEELLTGRQCTLEGWVHDGRCHVYGVVDSVRAPNRTSFARYQYPSTLPRRVQDRMIQIACRLMNHIGYDHAPFNMEMYWDRKRDRIGLLEVNARFSQSHGELFERVDGVPNHQVMVQLGLGEAPSLPHRRGAHPCAAKLFLRRERDAVVTRVPTPHEIQQLEDRFPTASIIVEAEPGTHLDELQDQDSYTYELGVVFVAGRSQQELLAEYHEIVEALDFQFAPAR